MKYATSFLLFATLLLPPLLHAQADPAAATGIAISQATLDELVGNYRTAQGITLKVWRAGGSLMIQADGQAAWALLAESESSFKVSGMDAKITFGFTADGKPGYLILTQAGHGTKAIRQ